MDLIDKYLGEGVGFVQKLDQKKKGKAFSGKEIAKKMRANKILSGQLTDKFAKKVEKMKTITSKELDHMLPDYIEGRQIYGLFGE